MISRYVEKSSTSTVTKEESILNVLTVKAKIYGIPRIAMSEKKVRNLALIAR